MSALNVFLTPTEAHMFTDGALYEQDTAIVRGMGPKTIILPHYNAVIGATGIFWVSQLLVGAVAETKYDGFDAMADDLARFIKAYVERSTSIPNFPKSWGKFEIALAGWSDRANGPAAFYLRGFNDGHDEAFVAYPATRFYSPDLSQLAEKRMDLRFNRYVFDPDNPAASGLELMELQRSIRFVFKEGNSPVQHHAVGGFCQHSTVTRESITTTVLKRWPDKIGERISMPFKMPTAGSFSQ